jgi:hypothetical protein
MSSAFSPLTPSRMLSLSQYMEKKVARSVNDEPWKRAVAAQPKDVTQLSSKPKTGTGIQKTKGGNHADSTAPVVHSEKVSPEGGISWADITAARIAAGDNSAVVSPVVKKASQQAVEKITKDNGESLPRFSKFQTEYNYSGHGFLDR